MKTHLVFLIFCAVVFITVGFAYRLDWLYILGGLLAGWAFWDVVCGRWRA